MKINEICKKLVKNNKSHYTMLMFCFIFDIVLITSLGLIVFSGSLKDTTTEGGTTRSMAYITLGVTCLGSLMFTNYAHSLFMKYKSKQIGVFISLGMKRNDVKKILLKELLYILPIGGIVAIALGVLLSYWSWSIITKILDITDISYKVGWKGLLVSIIFAIISMLSIKYKTSIYIKKVDIINIIKNEQKIEDNKVGNYILGIIGICIAPLGFWLFAITTKGLIFKNFSNIKIGFILLVLIGLYLIVSQLGVFGQLVKKFNKKKYYKNIMLYNLLNLKSKQYANTLFTVIILIGITIFFSCMLLIGSLATEQIIEMRYPFDYSIRKTVDQNYNITKEKIFNLSKSNKINIKYYNEFEVLILGRERKFNNKIQILETKCISENEYNRIYNENIDIKPGYYNMYAAAKSNLKSEDVKNINFMVVGNDFKQKMIMNNGIWKNLLENASGIRADFFVLDNGDYNKLKEKSPKESIESQTIFNVDNWKSTQNFYRELKDLMMGSNEKGIKLSGELIYKVYNGQAEEFISQKEMTNKKYKEWKYKLECKVGMFADERFKSMYYILCMYIVLLSLVASSIIIYIKVLNTSWQDNKIYKNIALLGANNKYIKSIITRQLLIIFFVPTITGTILGIAVSNLLNSEYLYSELFRGYSIIVALIFIIVQFCMFLFTRFIVIKTKTKFYR